MANSPISANVESGQITETQLYDDCFEVKQTRWGTWNSFLSDGTKLVTSLTESDCIEATRFYLKCKQESAHDGVVGGKL